MDKILNQKNWDELIIRLRIDFPQLTDEDIKHEEGTEEKMLRMIEYKVGKTKDEMRLIIASFSLFSP